MNALNRQVGGTHYQTSGVQHVTFCQRNRVPWAESCAIKYLMRWRKKNGLQDLEKALHYLELCCLEEYVLRQEAGLPSWDEMDPVLQMDPRRFPIKTARLLEDNEVGPVEAEAIKLILAHHVANGEHTLRKAMVMVQRLITEYKLLA